MFINKGEDKTIRWNGDFECNFHRLKHEETNILESGEQIEDISEATIGRRSRPLSNGDQILRLLLYV